LRRFATRLRAEAFPEFVRPVPIDDRSSTRVPREFAQVKGVDALVEVVVESREWHAFHDEFNDFCVCFVNPCFSSLVAEDVSNDLDCPHA
jgi:hypothetical protein